MDLNIATTFVNNNHDNKMFNAMKTKFDVETVSASPPKFNIPLLKIPGGTTLETIQTDQSDKSPTQLNKFLIKKLQEKHSSNDRCGNSTDFVIPHLTSPAQTNVTVKYELPAFQTRTEHSSTYSLTAAINKLQVQDNSSEDGIKSSASLPTTIDLTTALASKLENHQSPPIRDLSKPRQTNDELDFEIPFIDCDRQDASKKQKLLLPASNDYCTKDISQLLLHHTLAEPSAVGRFLSADSRKYLEPLPLKYFTPQLCQIQVKHSIEPFHFDTKSPDDVVLLALSKYQRRHYN